MRARTFAGIAAGTLALLTLAAMPASAADPAKLSVFHGVPGLTVDVWVNGERTLDDFTPGSMAGPLDLAAGTYTVAITAADAADASAPAIGPVDLPLEAGKNYTAVAHLDAAGAPTATLFTNDISTTAAGQGRLTVRHVAAAPGVDVLAGGAAVITNLTNPNEKVLNLPAGTVSASVTATGTTTPALLGPADVPVAEGTSTIVYAWGSATASPATLALATQTITGLHGTPSGVSAGEVGLVSDDRMPAWPFALGALAVASVVGLGIARRTSIQSKLILSMTGSPTPGKAAAPSRAAVCPRALGALLVLTATIGLATACSAQEPAPRPSVAVSSPSTAAPRPAPSPPVPTVPVRDAALGATPPPVAAPAPVRLVVPDVSIDMAVDPVGVLDDGEMQIPQDADRAGWYRFGPAPSDVEGATVLAAHVDSRLSGIGPFARLRDLELGSTLTLTTADGREHSYRVVDRQKVAKEGAPVASWFDRTGAPRLVLVTCGGAFRRDIGHYEDNVVVTAEPLDG